uniref:Uncharacterized protein n=1 Tax=Solanum tuberosum TaxID=4113 RepID=M1DL77_SOLTU
MKQQLTGITLEPPGMQLRPPNKSHSTFNFNMNKPHSGASSESSDNSLKLRRIVAIHVAISDQELDWARKIISLENSGMIQVKTPGNPESTSNDLSPIQKSKDSIVPIARSTKAILEGISWESPEVCPHIRPTSDGLNEISTTGEFSPGKGVHLTEISNHFNGGITGERISGDVAGAPASKEDQSIYQTTPIDEDNYLKVTIVHSKQQPNMNVSSTWQGKGITSSSDQKEKSPSNSNKINVAHDNVELKDVNNVSNVQDAGEDSST